MYIVGLTGSIASGKSTLSSILKEEFDAFIIDVDGISRNITAKGTPAYEDIVNKFRQDILASDGQIDRKKLGTIVFENPTARKELEAITHFRIWDETKKLLKSAKDSAIKIVILDVPLLIEVGWQDRVDEIWLVYLDRATQMNRLMKRDTLSLKDSEVRIESQISLEEKRKYAKVIIDNSQNLEKTREQVIREYRFLLNNINSE